MDMEQTSNNMVRKNAKHADNFDGEVVALNGLTAAGMVEIHDTNTCKQTVFLFLVNKNWVEHPRFTDDFLIHFSGCVLWCWNTAPFFCFFWWWLTPFTSDNLIAGFTDFWMSFPPILGWSNDEHMFWNGLNPPSSVKPTWPWLWVNISWLYDVHPAIPNGTWSNGQVRVVIPTKNSVRQCTWRAGGASFHFDGHVTIHQGHWQLLQVLLWWLDARLRQRWSSALSWCWSYKRSLGA